MLNFPRWKVWTTLIVIGAAILLAIPSLLPPSVKAGLPKGLPLPGINLGLDLAGGSYILLEARTEDVLQRRLEAARDTVQRVAGGSPAIGIGDISLRDGTASFMVRDPSQVDLMRQRLLNEGIGGTGTGGFGATQDWSVEVRDSSVFVITPVKAGLDAAVSRAMDDATEVVRRRVDEVGTREPSIIREGTNRIVVQVPGLADPQQLKDLLGKTAQLSFMMVDENVSPADLQAGRPPVGDVILPYPSQGPDAKIALNRRAIITGDQLTDARQQFDQQNGQPIVWMQFDSAGGKAFARVTSQNVGKRFAIVVDNVVISAPVIQSEILGGNGIIQGNFTVKSANELSIALRSGKLPVDLKVVQESTVSPELGADSIHAGITASIIAIVAVIVFMVLTYGRFGIYANIAVTINVLIILAVMGVLGATLTLPGIAGFVLTIGTAVDANVLINERIREERRRGRSVIQSVELGYKEASRTIFEANVTHAIAGLIMLALGSGPVRGFAVVLLIGIASSVFTAVVFTRLLVATWLRRKRPTEIHI